MNTRKALSALSMAAVLTLGLAGCSGDGEGSDSSGSGTEVVAGSPQSGSAESGAAVDLSQFEPFVVQDQGFQITFPAPIDEVLEESSEYVQQWTVEQDDDSGYMIGVLSGEPVEGEEPSEEWAREAMSQAVDSFETQDGVIIKENDYDLTFKGFPAAFAELAADVEGEKQQLFVLYFIDLETMDVYNIMTVGVSRADFDAFCDSFKVIE